MRLIRIALAAAALLAAAPVSAPLAAQTTAQAPAATAPAADAQAAPTASAPATLAAAPAAPPRTLRAYWHVFTAFALVWIAMFGYALSLGRRFRRLEGEVDALKAA